MENTTTPNIWLDQINAEAEAKAKELSILLNSFITPLVFVIEEGKDAAVAYARKPDAKTAYKMMLHGREHGVESASELLCRANLIREADIKALNPVEGMKASDVRFMDVNGKYAPEHTDLNTGLLLEMSGLVSPITDQFKKK